MSRDAIAMLAAGAVPIAFLLTFWAARASRAARKARERKWL